MTEAEKCQTDVMGKFLRKQVSYIYEQ
jgi:hypothetical protein